MSKIKRLKKVQGMMMKPCKGFSKLGFTMQVPLHWERPSTRHVDMSFFTALVALVASSRGSRLKALDSPPRSFNSGVDFCMSPRGSRGEKMMEEPVSLPGGIG